MEPKKRRKHKSNRGGARIGSGRKPVTDPKDGLTIYMFSSEIETLGGKEQTRHIAVDHLKAVVKKINLENTIGCKKT